MTDSKSQASKSRKPRKQQKPNVLIVDDSVKEEEQEALGRCPWCGHKVFKKVGANHECIHGHIYPSKDTLPL